MQFTRAIVRTPCRALVRGLTTANLGRPNYDKALQQHEAYISALEQCGLSVRVLPADEGFPDSCFVEDTALLTPRCAIVTRPGAPSRRGETDSMAAVLREFYEELHFVQDPGMVEAGDIMAVGGHHFIGLSDRTNDEGARQVIEVLRGHGLDGSAVEVGEELHLKTGWSYLEGGHLLSTGKVPVPQSLNHCKVLKVTCQEAYAANSLWINGKVFVPAGFPETQKMIEAAGYPTIALDMSEFQKLDGGLSCLSLRF